MGRRVPGLCLLTILAAPAAFAGEPPTLPPLVHVMTMNTWGLPEPVAQDRRSRFPLIADFVKSNAPDLDLVAFQEVWSGSFSLLPLDGLRHDRSEGDSGLALWSPHPIDNLHVHPFLVARGPDGMKRKGVLIATVTFPDLGPITVLVTHLQSGDGPRNAAVRAAQVNEILALVQQMDGPAMLLGDFNFYAGQPLDVCSGERLEAAGLFDAARRLGMGDNTWPSWGSGGKHRFDQVYLKDGLHLVMAPTAAEVVHYDDDPSTSQPRLLSDHMPLRVDVSAEPAGQ
jgi:endonuclease/exonuclease/phosphatase family metal-dependent hydrolase